MSSSEGAQVEISALVAALGAHAARIRAEIEALDAAQRAALTCALRAPRDDVLAAHLVLAALCSRMLGEAPPAWPLVASCATALSDAEIEAARAWCQQDLTMLGPVFERLVAHKARHAQGQFFTPAPIARHMAQHLARGLRGGEVSILDPAVGAGVLLAAVADERPDARLIARDVHPVCALMARAGLRARGVDVLVEVGDFLNDEQDASTVDAVICNPPYLRHHLIDPAQKRALVARYSARHGVAISSLSTGYVYFFLEALARLHEGGCLVFITPGDYLDVNYGQALRHILREQATIARVARFGRDALAFDGVLTTAAITTIIRAVPPPEHRAALCEVRAEDGGIVEETRREVDLREVALETSWTLQFGDQHNAHLALRAGRPRVLADYMRTRRGIATGANSLFVLDQATVDRWGIEPEQLVPVIASARDLPDGALTLEAWEVLRAAGRRVWLLDCKLPEDALEGTAVGAYLAHGRAQGVHERYNCRTRSPWYRVEQVEPPDIIITYMSRTPTRFVHNEARCRVMSVFLNGYLLDDAVDPTWLLDVLNDEATSALITQLGRTYGGGLGKIEPRELLRLPMPAPPAR